MPGFFIRVALTVVALAAGVIVARAQQPAGAPVKIVWGYTNPSSYYWDVYAAIELGYMKAEGLEIDAVNIPTVGNSMRILLTNDINVLSVSAEVAISAIEKDADITMVGAETTKPTYAFVVRPEIAGYTALRGKTLGVTQLEEASTTMLKLLLQKNGVKPGEYDLVTTGGSPSRFLALKTGAVAATMLSQPYDFLAEAEGMRILGYAFEAFDGPLVALAVQNKWAKANADALTRFLRATVRGARWLHDVVNKEKAIALLVRTIKCSEMEARKSYDLYFGPLGIVAEDLALSADGVRKYLDLRGSRADPAKFIDLSYLERALGR